MSFRPALKALSPYIPGRPMEAVKKAFNLTRVVKLASNENPYGCSPAAREAAAQSLADTRLYPDGACTALREAVADKFNVNGSQIVFGAGTDEVIAMLGKVFIEPGDECITAACTFSQYAASVLSMGGKMVYVPGKDFGFDLAAIPSYITEKTKIIFIANPNNPSGTYHTAGQQEALMQAVPSHITVVFDEAYQEYVTACDYPNTWETLRKYDNAILLKTFSKIYGLAGMRVGYGVMSQAVATEMEKIRSPFNVSIPAQAAAKAALLDTAFVQQSHMANRRVMALTEAVLTEKGLPYIPSQTNFLAVDIGKPSTQIFEEWMSKGYIVRSGLALGMADGYQRITIGTEEEMEGFLKLL
jgi:histidinol-phosphate aminotransferase